MKKFLAIIVFALSQACATSCDTLFVLQDAGETYALLPVIDEYDANHESFLILTGGLAAELLQKKSSLKNKTITYDQLGVDEKVDKSWGRNQTLSNKSLGKITQAIEAARVVVGVAFELQGQIIDAYKARNSTTFAYWDNINPDGTDPYFQTAKKVAPMADHLMVPTATFNIFYPSAEVVGQPALEQWKEELSRIDPEAVRAKLPFAITSPVIVFIGGYGDEYNEALAQFLDGAKELSNYTILLTYHPKMEGKVEKEQLANQSLPHVHLLDSSVSSMEAIALADHVICHQSTMGVQAALAGKHVIYFVPSNQSYTNLLIEEGAVVKVSTPEEQNAALKAPASQFDLFEFFKLPNHAQKLIYLFTHAKHDR